MKILITMLVLVVLLTGCGPMSNSLEITSLSEKINNNTDQILASSTIIKNNSILPVVLSSNEAIKNSANKIKKNIKELKTLNKDVIKLQEERDEAIKAKNSQINKLLTWLIIITIVLAGVFGVLFFLHGNKYGLTGSAICLVVCAISIFIQMYYIYIVIFGGLVLLSLVGLVGYNVIMKNRAFKEVVQSVEVIKTGDYKEKLNGIQSETTKKLVKKENS